ncbi:MAG: O-antigen ligase family protein [Bacteroidales bacterium]|nr:O-antigen ligase family protein [Bacteroidales bacterium]
MGNITKFLIRKDSWIASGFFTLCLTLFLMPFPRSWSLYALGAFLFFGFLMWISDFVKLKELFGQKWLIVLAPVCYFLLHIIYFMFDPKWIYLEEKLMFFLIPILGFPVFISDYFSKNLSILLKSFIYGIILICLFLFLRSTWESISFTDGVINFEPLTDQNLSRYNWDQLSIFEHPTYLTIKVLWVICLLAFSGSYLNISKTIRLLLILCLSIIVFFLSSRAGILILSFILIYFIYSYLNMTRRRILLLLIIPLILFGVYKITSLNRRMNRMMVETIERSAIEKTGIKGLDPRTKSWFSAMNLIKEKPVFGVGLNARNILAAEYARQGYKTEAELKLNAHNQFLETQLTFGVSGTLILFWMLGILFMKRKESWGSELIYSFLIVVIFSMFFESILVRQWGIMFFILFYCFLTMSNVEPDLRSGSTRYFK